ncbi:virulence plasmid B protein [Pseudomonas sp. GM18]|uniref:SpvB/TcaC N-terminal domain-containing protein n=1 Tax=Pseudomonas sp. GM18 TaxID=1144324 RepID=UPI00027230B0|nr:SpvB/TcaC N-terminal domain-containing protein [Pseudomonas sp. GM18]EJM16128.1 virulence plasmid B protein [Pseudomonas sp. GM18]
MANDADALITPPSIAKTASIATNGRSWGEIGATGQKSYTLPLPFQAGRTLNPDLALQYDGNAGNGPIGLSWTLNHRAISRRTSKGVPKYDTDDVMLADGTELRPELTPEGKIKASQRPHRHGSSTEEYSVVRYIPRLEGTFSRYELWSPADGKPGFWMVYGADGSCSCYGNRETSRIFDPENEHRVAMWLLVEIMNAVGEHIVFEYKPDDKVPDERHDYRAQRYLRQICYGNETASAELFCLAHEAPQDLRWYFRMVVDYGERSTDPAVAPPFEAPDENAWPLRSDPLHMHRYGFEVGTRRLCRQFLMYNNIGAEKVLVNRLLLEHGATPLRYNQLQAAHYMSYDAKGRVKQFPPLEYFYSAFELNTRPEPFLRLDHMPGLNDGQPYHCVDLYGEGVPGFLCQYDNAWYYREPLRGEPGTNEIVYGPWTLLPLIPTADGSKPAVQILTDLTGDGRLDWIVAQPGGSGYYTLNPDHTWSLFKPFSQFPVEYFQQLAQLGDLSGDGLDSMALIGPKSVRVYANLREKGFAPAKDVPHEPLRPLPLFSNARSELVFFGNMHASDLSGLCRIHHDKIECWPNLGHGTFSQGIEFSALPFEYANFNAEQVRIADLDGSGAPALIYLYSDYFEIYYNYGGNGLAPDPVRVPWPEGVRYDNLCQVTFADLQGLGCASLLLTVPHMAPQHWVYHFVSERPYLLNGCNNNMGYSATLGHVSSAQCWLDEKRRALMARERPVCYLPFPQQLLSWLRQDDEITGNYLQQFFEYFEGYYDGMEREFRGFGRVYQTDSELTAANTDGGHTAPMRVKNWFHTGRGIDVALKDICQLDDEATPLGQTLISQFDATRGTEHISQHRAAEEQEIAYALSGRLLRSEVSQADDPAPARLFSQSDHRYRVRQINSEPTRLMVLEQETRSYQYERFMEDPRCQHVVNLEWDEYGRLVHSFTVDCARRRTETDEPPFDEIDQRRAWIDSHDDQQQVFYLTETRADFIDLTDAHYWLLGLPSRQRSNALILPKGTLPQGLSPDQISYETFDRHQASAEWTALRELTSLSQQHYLEDSDGKILYPPLAGPLEQAQFDKKALAAYDGLPAPFNIRDELKTIGYQPMSLFFPQDPDEDARENLWSALSGFYTYAAASDFYQVTAVQQTASHGVTEITRDDYHLLTTAITLPDGCRTEVTYDYHHLSPTSIKDPNENIQEVLYEPGGQPLVHSFFGTEEGEPVGFKPLAEYPEQDDLSTEYAVENSKEVLAFAASAVRTDLFSWMPILTASEAFAVERKEWIARGLILPDGRIRARALRLPSPLEKLTQSEKTLLEYARTAPRKPVHSVVLQADRYHDDPLQLIQLLISYIDGFGRELQTKQRGEPGVAYVATSEGNLAIENGQLLEALADWRWRVSARVEYNHKGETIRVYRPYFINVPWYINDSSMRDHAFHDRMFYDAIGRLVKTINAKGDLAFSILHPWFTCSYDYNDTYEPEAQPAGRVAG